MPKHQHQMTVDEIVATLKHSNMPTLIVEGDDDVIVFRRLEERSGNLELSVMQAGGRKSLLQIFERISEIENKRLFFIADRDLWVLTGIPPKYNSESIAFTDGYSLENDAFIDTEFEKLLYLDEQIAFRAELECFIRWYALAVSRHFRNPESSYKNNANEILHDPLHREILMCLETGESFPDDLHSKIAQDPMRLLRGKSLLQVFMRQMTAGRHAKHTVYTMFEQAAAQQKQNLKRLFDTASNRLLEC